MGVLFSRPSRKSMSQQENERARRLSVDAEELEETLRILEKYSPQSPYLDNIHGHQGPAELDKVRDWAKEIEKRGHSISRIRLNRDDPPDVIAHIDGKPVGIEVTDLLEYSKKHALWIATVDRTVTILTWRQRQNGTFKFDWHGAELGSDEKAEWECKVKADPDRYKGQGVEWTLELFQTRLAEIVKTKDEKIAAKKAKRMGEHGENALDSRLHNSFLLIFTPEFYLQAHLDEYLEETEVRRPENFDRVFLMGHYVPGERARRHPVFEVRLSRWRRFGG